MTGKFPFIKAVSIVLSIVWYLQWFFLAVLIVISVLIATDNSIINTDKLEGFHIQFARLDIQNTASADDAQSNVFLTNGEGRLHIKDAGYNFIYLRMLSVFIDTLLYIFIIYMLKKIFAGVKTGVFFTRQNGIYIKYIAYAILGLALIPEIINYFVNLHISETLVIEGIVFKARFGFDFRTVFLALLIFVIAKAFIRGAELKEDHDLTI